MSRHPAVAAVPVPTRNRHQSTINHEISEVLFERRLLTSITGLAGLGAIAWLVAISTDYWIVVVPSQHIMREEGAVDADVIDGRRFLWSHSGLWKCCNVFLSSGNNNNSNSTETECLWHHTRSGVDRDGVRDFLRGELSVCVMTVMLIFLSAGFSVYSVANPRYMFKRIAGAMHVFVACMIFVLMEMVKSEFHLATHQLSSTKRLLAVSQVWYGYSYLLSWVVCIIFLVAALSFFLNSRKRKMLPFDLETNFK